MLQKEHFWRILSSERIIDATHLKVRCEQIELSDGTIIPDYYIIENRGWVGIVPITEDGHFIINKQYKHGIGLEVLEFPAGGIDDDEANPIQTAHRELMEETGYSTTPEQMEFLSHMLANPSGAKTEIWWYIAHNVRKTGEQKIDSREVIENFLVTPAELLALIHEGNFAVPGQIAAAYLALEHLGLLKMAV